MNVITLGWTWVGKFVIFLFLESHRRKSPYLRGDFLRRFHLQTNQFVHLQSTKNERGFGQRFARYI